ncbi:uncharacterized protein LOC134283493 [Saccostrea cucullata]|uniref:uncharacterized protein LOC134283493 n=1 Tax=Saccostrea cuccullata TaxID=36930 RepID=UPI002ED5B02C
MASLCAMPRTSDESPYYFGTSDLACVTTKGRLHLISKRSIQIDSERNRTKRAAPERHVLAPTHRWIYYKGYFFEWGTDAGTKNRLFGLLNDANSYSIKSGFPYKADKCNWMMEFLPAGYSSVPAECIMGCAVNYRTMTGDYSLLNNNCHHFANTISNILCSNICPDWCTTPL